VSKVKAAQASAYINLIPVFTLLMAYIILDERLNFQQLIASGLVLLGVMISQWQPKETTPEEAYGEQVKV
jgi:drug/metabolite transporter (DMT)-like permease